jgi:spore maturation protein CgeB
MRNTAAVSIASARIEKTTLVKLMRIFTAVRHSIDPKFYYGGLWSTNFYPSLYELGHEVIESEVDLLPVSKFMHIAGQFTPQETEVRARITQQILDEVQHAHRKKPLDLFLSYFYNAHFDPDGFAEIHRLGIPTVNFYCNGIYQFEQVAEISRKVNFAWHPEKSARPLYLEIGANPVWIQMAADPNVYHPVPHEKRQSKACFVGMRYADRDRLLAHLLMNDVPLDIYGKGWAATEDGNGVGERAMREDARYLGRPNIPAATARSYVGAAWVNTRNQGILGGFFRSLKQLSYRRKSRKLNTLLVPIAKGFAGDIPTTFARYEVNLNFSNVWADGRPGSRLIPHVRLRDFEAPMCRTCYLTGYTDEIAEFYELEKEILTYRTPQELVEKTKYYLSHPEPAERVRRAGYKRAMRDHTWKQRFTQLFSAIGLPK